MQQIDARAIFSLSQFMYQICQCIKENQKRIRIECPGLRTRYIVFENDIIEITEQGNSNYCSLPMLFETRPFRFDDLILKLDDYPRVARIVRSVLNDDTFLEQYAYHLANALLCPEIFDDSTQNLMLMRRLQGIYDFYTTALNRLLLIGPCSPLDNLYDKIVEFYMRFINKCDEMGFMFWN